MTLDQRDLAKLSTYVQRCQRQAKDLEDTREHYQSCISKEGLQIGWWQTPLGVVSLSLGSLLFGVIIGDSL